MKRTPEALVKLAKGQGWRVEPSKKGWKLYPEDKTKPVVLIHRTPSDHRWFANTVSQLRRSGLVIDLK